MNLLMRKRLQATKAKASVEKLPIVESVTPTEHAKHIATNFLNQVWYTHTAMPTVDIAAQLANRAYCVDLALRLSRIGRGSMESLPGATTQIQHHLAAMAVDAAAKSWDLNPRKLKHALRTAQENLDAQNLNEVQLLCPPINPPVPMKETEHPYLCPPVAIAKKKKPMPDDLDMERYEKALWQNMQDSKADELEESFADQDYRKPTSGWNPGEREPLTPVMESHLEPLTPIRVAVANPAPIASTKKSTMVPLTPAVAAPIAAPVPSSDAPSCEISIGWLAELSKAGLIELKDGFTFLAYGDSTLTDFNTWKEKKTEAQIRGTQLNLLKTRLSSQRIQGSVVDFVSLNNTVHRIERGMVIDEKTHPVASKIYPGKRLINGKEVVVLASEHPWAK